MFVDIYLRAQFWLPIIGGTVWAKCPVMLNFSMAAYAVANLLGTI
jgi:hypothetical protein